MKGNFFVLLFSISGIAGGQTPDWLWAKSAIGTADDMCNSICTDASGNVFVTGYFDSPSITFGTTTLVNADNTGMREDIFVVKYDPLGNVLWARSAGGIGNDIGLDIACDPSGNVIVSGTFQASSITFGSTTLTKAGNDDAFLAKYDGSGNVVWAKSAGGSEWDGGNTVSADVNGNIFMAGYFDSPSITFGTNVLSNTSNTGDIYIVKYDAQGNVLWAKKAGGNGLDGTYDISSDINGNVFLTGYFWSSSITCGSNVLANTSFSSDVFIAKYDAFGNVLWAKSGGSYNDDFIFGTCTDVNGNIFATGYFRGTTIKFDSTILTNSFNGTNDIFVVKYDLGGNLVWAKSEGDIGSDGGISISTDLNSNVFLMGSFQSSSIVFGSTSLTNSGTNGNDIFIVKHDSSGNILWAKSQGGLYNEQGGDMCINASGHVFLTGSFQSPSIIFGATTLTNGGANNTKNVFTAKLDNSTGIVEEFSDLAFSISPNPLSSQAIVQVDGFLRNATLLVYNTQGLIVKQIDNLSGKTIVFQKGSLSSGLYCIALSEDNKVFATSRLVILDY